MQYTYARLVNGGYSLIGSKLRLKALSDDTIFACDCSRLHQTRFRVRPTLGNREESGPIARTICSPDSITKIYVSFLSNPINNTCNFNI